MKKITLIFNLFLVFQTLENSNSQVTLDNLEYGILLICFVAAAFVMMFIPVILGYSMIGSFISMGYLKSKIQTEISFPESNSKYLKFISNKYLKAASNFYKNFIALAAWNILSLIYIVFAFDNFNDGLKEYFCFPLEVFQSLSQSKIFNSIYEFQSNWIFMSAIAVLTVLFYFLGKQIGDNVSKSVIKKMELN